MYDPYTLPTQLYLLPTHTTQCTIQLDAYNYLLHILTCTTVGSVQAREELDGPTVFDLNYSRSVPNISGYILSVIYGHLASLHAIAQIAHLIQSVYM